MKSELVFFGRRRPFNFLSVDWSVVTWAENSGKPRRKKTHVKPYRKYWGDIVKNYGGILFLYYFLHKKNLVRSLLLCLRLCHGSWGRSQWHLEPCRGDLRPYGGLVWATNTRWWFHVFSSPRKLGKLCHQFDFGIFFQDGWLQPPTRKCSSSPPKKHTKYISSIGSSSTSHWPT